MFLAIILSLIILALSVGCFICFVSGDQNDIRAGGTLALFLVMIAIIDLIHKFYL